MRKSKHNIISKIKDSEEYFIINLLTGNADVLDPESAASFMEGTISDPAPYIDKGYLMEEEDENRLYREKYLDFLDEYEESDLQIFFIPNYSCNFSCSYCYQESYLSGSEKLNKEVTDTFFKYIDDNFSDRKKYITIFGGEPLLPGKEHENKILSLLDGAESRGLGVAVVTNGYTLESYADIFKGRNIREIQVTLDGTEDVHNRRRPLKNGEGTFEMIVKGIDKALSEGFSVNLRVVVDRENIENLPALAKFAIDRGWTSNPLFKTQLGRNYELHTCQKKENILFSRLEMYEELYDMIKKHPEIIEFHKPAFSVAKYLSDSGELPLPLYDSCPGCRNEWAFDYRGNIYSCTATVGKAGEELGTFYPSVTKKDEIIAEWENRDVTSIPECRDCSMQLACGGGCASVAKNRTGKLCSPDCRPVKELLELGISLYF